MLKMSCVSDSDAVTANQHLGLGSNLAGCGRYIDAFWSVFSTKPQAERLATSELTRAGYRAYLPLIAIRRRDPVIPSQFHIVRVPMFSGYGFVQIDGPWVPIRYTQGVRDLLMGMDFKPARVSTSIVERLQAEDAERCQLEDVPLPELDKDTPVLIVAGALSDHKGRVVACDGARVKVEASLFGRLVPVWLDRAAVEVVSGKTDQQSTR